MIWNQKLQLNDVYSGLTITNDKMLYYSSEYKLIFKETESYKSLRLLDFKRDFDYKLFGNDLYLSCDNELKRYSFERNELTSICITDKQYIIPLSKEKFIAVSYNREEESYYNILLNNSCECEWKNKGNKSYRERFLKYLLFSSKNGSSIEIINLYNGDILWSLNIEEKLYGKSILYKDCLIIALKDQLRCYNVDSGIPKWKINNTFYHYNIEEHEERLYGLGGNKFEVINPDTGERISEKYFDENIHVIPTKTTLNNGYLYFSALKDNNIPVFGAINTEKAEIEFIQEVEVEGERSIRNRLGKPIVFGNRLYIRDSKKTLHVFERTDPEF